MASSGGSSSSSSSSGSGSGGGELGNLDMTSSLSGVGGVGGAGSGSGSGSGRSMSDQQGFHDRCGRRITLSNNNRTASRSIRDFNHALVFSAEPLVDDVLFEVVIEKKNQSWGGSIEIGVTSELPESCDLPSCALALRNGTWVMSGSEIRVDGNCLLQFYGTDLETLNENDRVGVLRTSLNDLEFYVNGVSQGVAARNMPKTLWALVDLYGRCVQVSVCPSTDINARGDFDSFSPLTQQIIQCIDLPMCLDILNPTSFHARSSFDSDSSFTYGTSMLDNNSGSSLCATVPSNRSSVLSNIGDYIDQNERLRFHTRCGSLVKLSPNCRSAERRRPLDEFNNGVVMTYRPLRDNELFEIRIDKLVDKWSGSIEVGVTTHNPTVLNFPATMTNMRSGTIMMSGCGILTNGKGTRRQYGEFNLDELREGDRVGMMRKSNGNLHYFINGQDQGVAATRVANVLWGVIDLYGMTIKVTIVDRDEREQQNLVTRRNNIAAILASNMAQSNPSVSMIPSLHLLSPEILENHATANQLLNLTDSTSMLSSTHTRNDDRLTFNPLCGSHAAVTLSGRTALRPNASDDFNNGVVLTRRPLRPNELFQVRLERVVTKWAGSVEMGVTTYSAEELEFPFTMTNVRSGTWMMTGNGVMHNGVTVIEQYGQNLDRLQVGDRVGVVRKDDGTLHFWVNGVDQGPAATHVPERVYGVIDLYGQAAQASIVDSSECGSPDTGNSTISNTTLYSETPLRFHTIHGKNAGISNSGLTASRPNSLAEFNDAIVFSNRPLRQRELFEVVLENMVRHWSGNIEIGVTGTRPEDIQMASNATDLDAPDTIVLSGPMVFHNRKTILSNWLVDLDTLGVGARVGVMRNQDFIHFFIDGVDQGPACECRSANVWAVIDLYGQCAQVSLTLSQPDIRAPYATSENSQSLQATSVIQPANFDTKHRWTCLTSNVTLSQNWTVAARLSGAKAALSHCIVFSEHPLVVGAPFEIKITSHNALFAGALKIGVTDLNLSDDSIRKNMPTSIKRIPANVWYVSGNEVRKNDGLIQRSMASLEWLRVGDRVALELTPARTLRVLLNSEDMKIQFQNIPNDVYVVAELQGATMAIQVISSQGPSSPLRPCSLRLQDSLDFGVDPLNKQDSMLESIDSEAQNYEFSEFCGKNIRLVDERRTAVRCQSYNHGLVFLAKPLCRGESVCIKIEALNDQWKGTIGVGVIGTLSQVLNLAQLPPCLMQLRKPCWAVTSDFINLNGQKIASKYADCLDQIEPGSYISLTLTHEGNLYLIVNLKSLEVMASGLPSIVYPVFDLFGKCDKISILPGPDAQRNGTPILEAPEPLEHDTTSGEPVNHHLPQREKADLEVHEKEVEAVNNPPAAATASGSAAAGAASTPCTVPVPPPPPPPPSSSGLASSMHRSVMESVSDNLVWNMSIKNRTLEQSRLGLGSSCSQLESLQLQHNTNLNIQRSQSTQRFQNSHNSLTSSAIASALNFNGTSSTNALASSDATTTLAAGVPTAATSLPMVNSSTSTLNTSNLDGINDTNKDSEALQSALANNLPLSSSFPSTSTASIFFSLTGREQQDETPPTSTAPAQAPANSSTATQTQATSPSGPEAAANTESEESPIIARLQREIQERAAACTPSPTSNGASPGRMLANLITDFANLYSQPTMDTAENDEVFERLYMLEQLAWNSDRLRERATQNQANFDPLEQLTLELEQLQHHLIQQIPDLELQQPISFDSLSLEDTASSCGTQLNSLQQDAIAQYDSMRNIIDLDPRECDYFNLVETFCDNLVLPQIFFPLNKTSICFCADCNGPSLEKLNGWVYFKLNQQTVNSNPLAAQIPLDNGDWVPLYYMTRVDKIRATLDHGQPTLSETASEIFPQQESQKDEPGTKLELHFSPNTFGLTTPPLPHTYRTQGMKFHIGTAFEVYVRRHSLCSTLGGTRLNCGIEPATQPSADLDTVNEIQTNCEDAATNSSLPSASSCATETEEIEAGIPDVDPTALCALLANDNVPTSAQSEALFHNFNGTTWFTKEAGACVITALILKLEKYD